MAMRYAMNADEKQFAEFQQAYSPKEEVEKKEKSEARSKLKRLFGG